MSEETLKEEIKNIHDRTSRSDDSSLIASWEEKEFYEMEGKAVDVFSVIFRTTGCFWSHRSGCTMCGYYTDTNPHITQRDLDDQLDEALSLYEGQAVVKIYTSGSFLDDNEVPEDLALSALDGFSEAGAEKVVVESRPGFVGQKKIRSYSDRVKELEVALGLESANDFILKNCINKGFAFEDYKKSVQEISEEVSIRTYLLLKPPFLLEKEAVEDVIDSIERIKGLTDIVSINPVNIQKGTLVEKLWKRDVYSPPWLWSIIDVLSRSNQDDMSVVISEAALGSKRGAHNCGDCDDELKDIIRRYNLTQNESLLESVPDCECRERWEKENQIETSLFFRGSSEPLYSRYLGYE
ncbi:MAG: archaeosine biosynthesis radical SAM protein RaSEA [Candidatus Natronoplasma sp.]